MPRMPYPPLHRPLRIRLIPLLVFVGVMTFGVRVHEIQLHIPMPSLGVTPSQANETASKEEAKDKEAKTDKNSEKEKGKEHGAAGENDLGPKPAPTQAPPPPMPPEKASMEVLRTLTGRREELDSRAKALDEREALLKITETRMDQKLAELRGLQTQLDAILDKLQQEQKNRLDSLISIYEKMKPQEASKILSAMDMPVLLDVMQAMKNQKVALILAAMDPTRAREITMALAKRQELSRMGGSPSPNAEPPAAKP